jgi:hypothetical protein
MNRNMEILDAEMGAPPPSTVDVAEVIARQQRLTRYRRFGAAMSTGVAVLAAALAVPVLSQTTAAGPGPHQPAAVVTATPAHTRQAEADRLTAELQRLMAAALPGAQFLPNPYLAATGPLVFADQGSYFQATAIIKTSAGQGTVTVSVGKEDSQFRETRTCSTDPAPLDVTHLKCNVQPVPGGGQVQVLSDTIGTKNYQHISANVIRPDGNAVWVHIANGVDDGHDYVGRQPTPALTKAQTVALAEQPGLATTMP